MSLELSILFEADDIASVVTNVAGEGNIGEFVILSKLAQWLDQMSVKVVTLKKKHFPTLFVSLNSLEKGINAYEIHKIIFGRFRFQIDKCNRFYFIELTLYYASIVWPSGIENVTQLGEKSRPNFNFRF